MEQTVEGEDRRGVRPRALARSLGVTANVVYHAIQDGELPAWRLGRTGRTLVVPADAIEPWLASKVRTRDGGDLGAED